MKDHTLLSLDEKLKELIFPENLSVGLNTLELPAHYKTTEEILLFARKENLYTNIPEAIRWEKYVLLIIKPVQNLVEVIPMDWFNKSGGDFGYVGPIYIARDKFDNRLHGKGIRMDDFTLDPSGKTKLF